MLPYSFPKFQAGIIAPPESSLRFSQKSEWRIAHPTIALALALLVPYRRSGGNTIDIDGVRIRIVQIGHAGDIRAGLILGLKANKRPRELLDSGLSRSNAL